MNEDTFWNDRFQAIALELLTANPSLHEEVRQQRRLLPELLLAEVKKRYRAWVRVSSPAFDSRAELR